MTQDDTNYNDTSRKNYKLMRLFKHSAVGDVGLG